MQLTKRPKERRQWRDWEARRACEIARELERAGDYGGARSALRTLWTKIGERPIIDNLPPDTEAEVLLRVGSVSGWLGSANQIPGTQEFARDLLNESISLFEALDQTLHRARRRFGEQRVGEVWRFWNRISGGKVLATNTSTP